MLVGFLFIAAGFASGFILRFGAFAIGVVALIAGYGLLLGSAGASWMALTVEVFLALLFLQVGYAGTIVARMVLKRMKARSLGFGRRHNSLHVARASKPDNSTI
jgi:hypothetical protein